VIRHTIARIPRREALRRKDVTLGCIKRFAHLAIPIRNFNRLPS
jgi:hypothetical protein